LGFIGYSEPQPASAERIVRIFMECRLEGEENAVAQESATGSPAVTCGAVVDVVFPGGKSEALCRLRGVDDVLVLKKFYKLVFSLEERAREHGNDWRAVMESPEGLLEHLRYTRNARDFTGQAEPLPVPRSEEMTQPECAPVSKRA
jgi:hypothetical protein